MKSVMHDKDERTCFLCMVLEEDYSKKDVLEEHHVFRGVFRSMAERYGLKVYLCPEHHRTTKAAVHQNKDNAEILMMCAQKTFEKTYSRQEFMAIFGKNRLWEIEQ